MPTARTMLVAFLVVLTAFSTPAFAQQRHVVDPAAIAATVEQQLAKQDADRDAVRRALARAEVKDLARSMGVDLDRATASLTTLAGADLERAASPARRGRRRGRPMRSRAAPRPSRSRRRRSSSFCSSSSC